MFLYFTVILWIIVGVRVFGLNYVLELEFLGDVVKDFICVKFFSFFL